ncbi:WxL domain-containing protein [Enterococcus rotai]|uniref:WxL domain-containing protein n=1 Tax=Enterococcus rotai TaxID=118060 RepID=UPI0032B34B69
MKLTHKLCGAALLATLGVSIALPSVTKANEPGNALPKAGMDIQFTENTGDGTTITTTNSNGEDVTITSGLVTTDAGTFGLRAGTPLNFGKDNSAASGTNRSFFAKNAILGLTGGEEKTVENYISFVDDRSTVDHRYQITAEITEQLHAVFEGKATELTGAELSFLNGTIYNEDTKGAESELTPTAPISTAAVKFGGATMILDNTNKDQGRGNYKIIFGNIAEQGNATDSEKSVKLTVQDKSELFAGTAYTGGITWKMNNIPTAPAG